MTAARISVVMAACEGAPYIEAQLGSILPQLGAADEVVICDDASRDDTVGRIRAIGDARLRVLENAQRLGYVANFERAARAASGEYLFFSDQDDVWLPRKVETLLAALAHAPCVASDAVVVDARLQVLHPSYFALRRVHGFSPVAIFLRPPIIGATMACHRAFLERLLPFPRGVPHDFWLSLNAALRGRLHVVREPLILYRRHGAVASLSATGGHRRLSAALGERVRLLRAMASAWA